MKYNPQIHHRRSIRFKEYDYGQPGKYFVTICTHKKQCWFGEIRNSQMHLNHLGSIVAQEWLRTPKIRPEIVLDEWIIMPNHLHGIIAIAPIIAMDNMANSAMENERAHVGVPPQLSRQGKSLSSIIAGFKSATTKRINILRDTPKFPLWQRNYYESAIRNQEHLERIQDYIRTNPSRWRCDPEFSQSKSINYLDLPF